VSEISIFQAKIVPYPIERMGALPALADPPQNAFRQIHVLEILQVLQDRFAGVVSLRAPGALG
jgi:hypothetical protein